MKAENEKAKAQNKGEYKDVLNQIDELQVSNRKFKQENSELVKENYLMEEEKEELTEKNEKLQKKIDAK